jgi:CRP/FNR family transcriptional regulator, cyclic AMP receptor protein
MRISLPSVRGCSVSSALHSGSAICRLLLAGGPVAGEGLPPLQPDLKLDDTVPFRLSRNHFMIEKRDGNYYVRDLCSTLGTIVNGEPIGDYFRGDDAALRAGENEVIAGGVDSPFVFSVFIG